MIQKQFTAIIFMHLFFTITGTAWASGPVMKKPLMVLPDQIPTVISSQKILKSSSRLLQSPGTVLDSTYYDWQRNGSLDDHLEIFNYSGTIMINGTMMVSYQEDLVNRTMAYYFWNGASWTGHGWDVFPVRNGFGSMSQFDDGRVVISTHGDIDGYGTRAFAAYDAFPGIYAFSYYGTDEGNVSIWPRISVNSDGSVTIVGVDQGNLDVSVARAPDGGSEFGAWTNLRTWIPDWMDNDMHWPTVHSGTNGKVGIAIPDFAGPMRLLESTDNGNTWSVITIAPAETLLAPVGLDSTAARAPWIVADLMYIGEEPHVVWSAGQIANAGGGNYGIYDFKSEILHWSPSTGVSTVVVADYQSAEPTRPDYVIPQDNHLSVDFASLGVATDGTTLVCVYTAFDPADTDPTSIPPDYAFGDIWVTSSSNSGATWSDPINVTNPDGSTLGWDDLYPSLARTNIDNAADPGKDVYMIYQSDNLAGTYIQGTEGAVNMDYIKFLGIELEILPIVPVANFSADPTSGERPLTVDFTDLSTGQITDWVWDFGDGDSSFVQHPTHVYNDTGLFTVSLGIRGPEGVDDTTMVDLIHVIEPPVIYLTVTPDTTAFPRGGEVGFTVALTNNTSETVLVDGWTDATLPSGRHISPEAGPVEFYLGPWHTLDMYVTRPVPPLAPLGGPYTFCVVVGDYPETIYAQDCFEFDVVLGAD